MTLHENLERKRRQNIAELNESGACHLCKCTTGERSYRRFVGHGDRAHATATAPSSAPAAAAPTMRTCMCYGNSAWPFPLRVCEMCIADDLTTGRIRHCAICGVVACDEDCGEVELVEVTDRDEWNNAGCLECRGMESFSELALFRQPPAANGATRATRVCTGCIELFSLFSSTQPMKYHFKCRYFKCNNLLVPSRVVELKRFLKPFPLGLLPDEILDSIVDFLGGRDLLSFGRASCFMFTKVERVSKKIVSATHHQLPTGPTQLVKSNTEHVKDALYVQGKNPHSLRAPEDGMTWIGVLNKMEQLTKDIFYFDFQTKGGGDGGDDRVGGGDDGVAMRYLRNPHKLGLQCVYSKGTTEAITPYESDDGLSMRGGQVLVTKYKWHFPRIEDREDRNHVQSIIFSTDRALVTGVHRVIVRYNCFCGGGSLGSIGVLRQGRHVSLLQHDPESVTWAQSSIVDCQSSAEEHIFGMDYDAHRRVLRMYKKNGRTNKMEPITTNIRPPAIADEGGNLCFAAALSSGSAGIKGNQLSIRACREDEWTAFLSHTAEKQVISRIRGRGRRGVERMMWYLDHRARREIAGENNGNDNVAARAAVEDMMDMMMEEEMEHGPGDDSDLEEDNMHVDVAGPGVLQLDE